LRLQLGYELLEIIVNVAFIFFEFFSQNKHDYITLIKEFCAMFTRVRFLCVAVALSE